MKTRFLGATFTALALAALGGVAMLADGNTYACWPTKAEGGIGCYLRTYPELMGAMIGAAGTLIAGVLAWGAVQQQIAAAENLYWQTQRDAADMAINGLSFIEKIMNGFLNEAASNSESDEYPYISMLRRIQVKGFLDITHFTPTGNRFTAWHMSRLTTSMRTQWFRLDKSDSDNEDIEANLKQAMAELAQLKAELEEAKDSEIRNRSLADKRLRKQGW